MALHRLQPGVVLPWTTAATGPMRSPEPHRRRSAAVAWKNMKVRLKLQSTFGALALLVMAVAA